MKNISTGNYNLIEDTHLRECIEKVLENNQYHGYSSPKGIKELRTKISSILETLWHFSIDPSNLLITTGSQQSIHLIIDAFLKEKEKILIEEPTYFGAIKVFQNQKLKMMGIPIQEEGINLIELEKKILEEKPKWIYVVPTFNNPTGYAWSKENRIRFLELINRYHLFVIEDDPYSLINLSDQHYPSLYQLNHGKNVIYLGTFSKYISSSINVGYILADSDIISKLYGYKESYDLCTSLFHQQVILTYLETYDLIQEVQDKISHYKKCLNDSFKKLRKEYKDHIEITIPKGGLFFLVRFKNKDTLPLLQDQQTYFIHPQKDQYVRVNICSILEEEKDTKA